MQGGASGVECSVDVANIGVRTGVRSVNVYGIILGTDETCEMREGWDDSLLEVVRLPRSVGGVGVDLSGQFPAALLCRRRSLCFPTSRCRLRHYYLLILARLRAFWYRAAVIIPEMSVHVPNITVVFRAIVLGT